MSTLNDKAVLNAVFNPLLPNFNFNEDESKDEDDNTLELEESQEYKETQLKGIKEAEEGRFKESIEYFQQAITISPENPSAYNNLAQSQRLMGDMDGAVVSLDKAITLGQGRKKVLRQAYCQRGLIRRAKGDQRGFLEDFEKAAQLGSEFAKNELVKMNPYSALCNQMLTEMFEQLRNGSN